jgi:hypothetical protein
MLCRDDDSHTLISSLLNPSYSSSDSSSASASSQSDCSDASSQSSDDTCVTTYSDSDSCDAYCASKPAANSASKPINFTSPWTKQPLLAQAEAVVPAELRQNPRRSSSTSTTRTGCPPALLRQSDRKVNFVDSLVGKRKQMQS